MRTHPGLRTQARTAVVATPALQLALKFLRMPATELEAAVRREILSNPALELDEETEETASGPEDSPTGDSGNAGDCGDASAGAATTPAGGASTAEALPSDASDPPDAGPGDWPETRGETDIHQERDPADPADPYRALAGRSTLADLLIDQLRLLRYDPAVLAAGVYLIGSLDDRGYLGVDLVEAARDLGVGREVVEAGLAAVQSLDPAGVGARDLRECLLLQLAARGRRGSLAWKMVEEQFENLARRRMDQLRRRLAATPADLQRAVVELRRLSAHPARLAAAAEVDYIYPDLAVEKVENAYEVVLLERSTPRLRISRSCRRWLQEAEADSSVRAYAGARLRSARWLIQALDRRRRTMLRVMRCLVEEQRGFFEKGVSGLSPLTMRVVAARCGLSESTVARVASGKYVQTPRGVLPLKFFFAARLATREGNGMSNRAVRERIRLLVAGEGKEAPLSDERIARTLAEEGVCIARRTVAKYRENLGIEPSRLRRRDTVWSAALAATAGDPRP